MQALSSLSYSIDFLKSGPTGECAVGVSQEIQRYNPKRNFYILV